MSDEGFRRHIVQAVTLQLLASLTSAGIMSEKSCSHSQGTATGAYAECMQNAQ